MNQKQYSNSISEKKKPIEINTVLKLFKEHLKNSNENPQFIELESLNLTPLEDVFNYYKKKYINIKNQKFNPRDIRKKLF